MASRVTVVVYASDQYIRVNMRAVPMPAPMARTRPTIPAITAIMYRTSLSLVFLLEVREQVEGVERLQLLDVDLRQSLAQGVLGRGKQG